MKRDATRQATERLLEMVEEGLLDRDNVIMACVKYMSEDDVADMMHINEFFTTEEDEDETPADSDGDDDASDVG
jgi:enamine deaminase RidA (YjgF/YER057c/UK114 family)